MDGLTIEERLEAWKSAWHISLDGWAIVDEDFLFRSVNPQWMELLDVLPSEFIGRSFEDITPPDIRELDAKNAELVKQGKISSYILHKTYQFKDKTTKKIVLLVVRVPIDGAKPFQFYLSRILLDEDVLSDQMEKELESVSKIRSTLDNGWWGTLVSFLTRNAVMLFSFGLVLAGIIIGLINEFFQLGFF